MLFCFNRDAMSCWLHILNLIINNVFDKIQPLMQQVASMWECVGVPENCILQHSVLKTLQCELRSIKLNNWFFFFFLNLIFWYTVQEHNSLYLKNWINNSIDFFSSLSSQSFQCFFCHLFPWHKNLIRWIISWIILWIICAMG